MNFAGKSIALLMIIAMVMVASGCKSNDEGNNSSPDETAGIIDNGETDGPEIVTGERYTKKYEIPDSEEFIAYNPQFDYDQETKTWSSKLAKFNMNGSIIWEKDPTEISAGVISDIAAYPDGRFVISYWNDSIVAKLDNNGNVEWMCDLEYAIADQLFLTETGDLIAIGSWEQDFMDIVVTRIDDTGHIVKQKSFGGSDYDLFIKGSYKPDTGLVFLGLTHSNDGDFGKMPLETFYFVACIDVSNLTLKWTYMPQYKGDDEINDHIDTFGPLVVSDGYTYVAVESYEQGYETIGSNHTVSMLKLDAQGDQVWKAILGVNIWAKTAAITSDGRIVVNCGLYTGQSPEDVFISLFWLNQEGIILKKPDIPNGFAQSGTFSDTGIITLTDDGGFIIVTERIVSVLPALAESSVETYDTDTVAIKYNKDDSIQWQKIYDNYTDSEIQDMAIPLRNGRIIIE